MSPYVECIPETGRTHRIGRTCAISVIRFFLTGDTEAWKYCVMKPYGQLPAVHRKLLQNLSTAGAALDAGFCASATGQQMDTSPLPDDMERLIGKWRAYIKEMNLNKNTL